MEFQEHIDDTVATRRLLVNFFQKFQGVDSLHHVDVGGDIFHLVGLQVAYEMPDNVVGERLMLQFQFLFVTLTEDTLALSIGSLDILIGMILAYSHQTDTLRQRVEYTMKISFDVVHHPSNSGLASAVLPYS